MAMVAHLDFSTLTWLGRRSRELQIAAELTFYKDQAEKMAAEIERMSDELKQGNKVLFNGMTILQELPPGVRRPD